MSPRTALTTSVGVLGAVSTALTADVLPIPVWVLFTTWACFFLVGPGLVGATRSLVGNLAGIFTATLTLALVATISATTSATTVVLATGVGLGSAGMVQLGRLGLLSATPAVVIGFAMTVAVSASSGFAVTHVGWQNPAVQAAAAAVTGVAFGYASERLTGLLSSRGGKPRGDQLDETSVLRPATAPG